MLLTTLLIVIFVIGYAAIATEHNLKINKTATALLMCVLCWVIYMAGVETYFPAYRPDEFVHLVQGLAPDAAREALLKHAGGELILHHMGDVAEIVFFLMGAMTIVEVVDVNGGFNFVRDMLTTSSKRSLLWRLALLTFFLSAILDNLTTTIVMIMVMGKLVNNQKDRWMYTGIIVLSANSGGAFSPIGDVTTIMLWIRGMLSTEGVIGWLFLPSFVSMLVPAIIMHAQMKGKLDVAKNHVVVGQDGHAMPKVLASRYSKIIFIVGVGGLIFVPFFRALTGLPPFMGILLVFGLLWAIIEFGLKKKGHVQGCDDVRVNNIMRRIDLSTLLFFLGILMAVSAIQETGLLRHVGEWLDDSTGGNTYVITGAIGALSAVVDNVPLVASCMAMYDIAPATDVANAIFAVDGQFWLLLAYCAGVGGSMLIIGSAAGVVAMGIEKITFGWWIKHITLLAATGYLSGIACYWVIEQLLH